MPLDELRIHNTARIASPKELSQTDKGRRIDLVSGVYLRPGHPAPDVSREENRRQSQSLGLGTNIDILV